MRCSPLKASRAASAVARSCCFDWLDLRAGMQRCVPLSSPAKAGDPVFHRAIKPNNCRVIDTPLEACHRTGWRRAPMGRSTTTGDTKTNRRCRNKKCEATMAVGALDPGVPYESRWAPYVRVHGPGQGQFPKGSIRPRGYMASDARRSFALAM